MRHSIDRDALDGDAGRPFGHGIDTLSGDADLTGTRWSGQVPVGAQRAIRRRR